MPRSSGLAVLLACLVGCSPAQPAPPPVSTGSALTVGPHAPVTATPVTATPSASAPAPVGASGARVVCRLECSCRGVESPTCPDVALDKLCHAVADPVAADSVSLLPADASVAPGNGVALSGDQLRSTAQHRGLRALLGLAKEGDVRVYLGRDCRSCRRAFVDFVIMTDGAAPVQVKAALDDNFTYVAPGPSRPTPAAPLYHGREPCPASFPHGFVYLGCSPDEDREMLASIWMPGKSHPGMPMAESDPEAKDARCFSPGPHDEPSLHNWCCR